MAKYTVKFSCGHTAEVKLFGKSSERESYIAWAEKNGECPECKKARKELANDVIAKKYFPEIKTGTEKQIKFANDLRVRMYRLTKEVCNWDNGLKNLETLKTQFENLNQKTKEEFFYTPLFWLTDAKEIINLCYGKC